MRETFEAWYFQTRADYREVDGPFPDNLAQLEPALALGHVCCRRTDHERDL